MKKIPSILLLIFISTVSVAQVSNIKIKQDDLKKIMIQYDLTGSGNYEISLFLKKNSWEEPVLLQKVRGDVGTSVPAGMNKTIEWDATAEVQDLFTDKAEFLIKAIPLFIFSDNKLTGEDQAFGNLEIIARECSIWINDSLAGNNTISGKFSPGTYKIKATSHNKDYMDEIREIDLKSGESKQLELVPKLLRGEITIKSTPSSAEIILDGTPTNHVTPHTISVNAGKHTILLKKKGYLDNSFDVLIDRNNANFLLEKALIKGMSFSPDFLKYRRRKTFWLISAIITAGTGVYAYQQADTKYNDYLEATGSTDVENLKKKYQLFDRIYPVAFGAAGFCLLEFIIQGGKQAKAKKQMSISPISLKGGGGISLTYQF
ncbi:MAG: PEGA domain-containing protein [Mangrovibacterium sp.]